MKLTATSIAGAYVIEPEPASDERGWFARVFDGEVFAAHGLATAYPQHSLSFNAKRGTLRGMHYQASPGDEAKIVRCIAGAMHDVIVDLRTRQWFAIELSAANRLALYVPPGCAHGFLTLSDGAEVLYLISRPYEASLARGVRWNDPAFGIAWPFAPSVISERDASYADVV